MLKSIRFASIDKVSNLFIRTAHTEYSQLETTVNGLVSDFTVPFASARLGNFKFTLTLNKATNFKKKLTNS
jgi:hypothetical protein